MRCTDCLADIKPVAALDIDGTLADYHDWFGRMACGYWNKEHPAQPWDGRGEMEDYLGLTKAEYREAKMAFRQGGYKRNQPMDAGAPALVHALRASNVELWVTTTRPWKRLDNIDPDTQWWLGINGLEYDHLLYDDDKYGVLAERVGVERVFFVLDDLPEQYCRAVEVFGHNAAVMIERPHNTWWRRVSVGSANAVVSPSLNHARMTAVRYLDEWYERYAA